MAGRNVTVSVGGDVSDFSQSMDQAAESYKEFDAILKRGKATFDAIRTPAERYEAEIADLSQQLRAGAISQEIFNRAVGQSREKFDAAESAAKRAAHAQSALGKASTIAGGVLGAFGISFGIDTVVSGLKTAIQSAEEAAREQAKLEAVVKATGGAAGFSADELSAYADTLERATGVSGETVSAGEAILATFRNIKGDQFKEATKLALDMSAVMDTDLKSSILQIGKALNNPTEGINALRRAGVSFTAEQKEQIKTLQESGDLLGAQKIILRELADEFGGAAERMRSPLQGLTTDIGNFGESIGGLFTNGTQGGEWLDSLGEGIRGVTEIIQQAQRTGIPDLFGLGAWREERAPKELSFLEKVGEKIKFLTGQQLLDEALASGLHLAGMGPQKGAAILNPPAPELPEPPDDEDLDEFAESTNAATAAQKHLAAALKNVSTAANQIGLTDSQKKLEDLAEAGASGAQLEQAQKELAALDAAKEADEAAKKAKQAEDRLKDMLDRAIREGETAGMSDVDKKLFDLKSAGADDGQLAQARQALEAADAAKQAEKAQEQQAREAEKLAQAGEKLKESLYDPAQKYNATVSEANALLNEGLIDAVTHQKALTKAADDYQQAMSKSAGATGAMEKGSKEAFAFIEEARRKAAAKPVLPMGPNPNALPPPPGENIGAPPMQLGGKAQKPLSELGKPGQSIGGKAPPSLEDITKRAAIAMGASAKAPEPPAPIESTGADAFARKTLAEADAKIAAARAAGVKQGPSIGMSPKEAEPKGAALATKAAADAAAKIAAAKAGGPKEGPSLGKSPQLPDEPIARAKALAAAAGEKLAAAHARQAPSVPTPEPAPEPPKIAVKPDITIGGKGGVGLELKDSPAMQSATTAANRGVRDESDTKKIVENTGKTASALDNVNKSLEKIASKLEQPQVASI